MERQTCEWFFFTPSLSRLTKRWRTHACRPGCTSQNSHSRCRITCGMTTGGGNTQLFSPCQGAARALIHSAPGSYHLALKRASC
eukprot:3743798-Rhodomonas_salina.1